jgi:hypothetical protein
MPYRSQSYSQSLGYTPKIYSIQNMDHNMSNVRPSDHALITDDTPDRCTRQKEVHEMKQWVDNLILSTPLPRDLLSLLAKDDTKQMEIVLRNMSLGTEEKKK